MNNLLQTHFDHIWSDERQLQSEAFFALIEATDQPVTWAYTVWDKLVTGLRHPDNHIRAIAAQVLCNLAKSDPEQRMLKDFKALLAVTKDERFVTARHCLQALWKIGIIGPAQQQMVIKGLAGRFTDCAAEKNCSLIRYDILKDLRQIYDVVNDERIRQKALALIETEPDAKYRKKYAPLWRPKR